METHIKQTDLDPDIFTLDEQTSKVSLSNELIGLDLSSFDHIIKKTVFVVKSFIDADSVVIPIDIPEGIRASVISAYIKGTDNIIRDVDISSFVYNTVTKTFNVFLDRTGTGEIIIGFHK